MPDITATETAPPIDDLQVTFGEVYIGNTSDMTVTVTNNGTEELVINDITSEDLDDGPFSIEIDNCSAQQTIPTDGTCTIIVRFTSSSAASFNDSFDILSDDPDENSVTISISGTGASSIINNNPSPFALVYPANGQAELPPTFQFIWKKTTDPDGDSLTYILYYCDNPDVESCGPTTITSAASFDNRGVFYGSIVGNWLILLIGTLIAGCLKGKKGIGIWLLIIMLMIGGGMGLSACSGSGGGGDNPTQSPASPAQPTPGDDEVGHTVSDLSSGTTYYWKVVATDGKGGSTETSNNELYHSIKIRYFKREIRFR